MEVYLDNAATTKLSEEVVEEIENVSKNIYGNPSSVHEIGLKAERLIKNSREKVADKLGIETEELYFTSGATESNNTAIFGTVYANKNKGNHIITSKIEHPSVLQCFERLEKEGFEVTYLNVNNDGIIDLEQLENAITDRTIFVSVMTVNNETGVIEPIREIAKMKRNHNFILHTDAVQAFMKVPSYYFDCADIISISGHKIHALKGVGAIAIKKGVKINPLILGGGQEKGFRSGTENLLGITSLAKATEGKLFDLNLKSMLIEGIKDIENIKINSKINDNFAPHILSVTFPGKRGEVILHALEEKDIYVSTGSACHSNRFGESHVLSAIGLKKDEIGATIRISFGRFNTKEDIEYTIKEMKEIIKKYRK